MHTHTHTHIYSTNKQKTKTKTKNFDVIDIIVFFQVWPMGADR